VRGAQIRLKIAGIGIASRLLSQRARTPENAHKQINGGTPRARRR